MESNITKYVATEADIDFARKTHHEAYHDVVVRQFGMWNEVKQDAYFEKNWTQDPIEIIEYGRVPCGWIALKDHGDHLELVEMLLLPEFQGQGIGSRIMNDIIATAKVRNIPLRLHVLHENKAVNLYRRFGLKETGKTATHIEMEFDPSETHKTGQ